MRIHFLLALVLAMLSANAQAADREKPKEQYLCVSEQAAGFKYDKNAKQWERTIFSNTGKYVISKATRSQAAFEITEVGDNGPLAWCKEGFSSSGVLFCKGFLGEFRFNKTNGRFINSYLYGYIEVGQERPVPPEGKLTDDKTDTPYMQIGKCSPF